MASALLGSPIATAQVAVTSLGTPYTQNFDTLPASSSATWTDNATIVGWYAQRTGTGTTIVASDGATTAGNLYSFGSGSSQDRALGTIGSGNAAVGSLALGLRLRNDTGGPIEAIAVGYTGEQWRNSGAAAQTLEFSYRTGTNLTSLQPSITAGWTAVTALDFTSPVTGGSAGALDGNVAANRTVIGPITITLPTPLANGEEILLRWRDVDHTGSDHGLAIDDVTVGAPAANQPITASSTPASVTTLQGTAASSALTASDPDSIVIGASIISAPVAGIALADFVAATADGGSATATLGVDATVAPGNYSVVVRFSNNESQTADVTIPVTVQELDASGCPVPSIPLRTIPEIQGAGAASPFDGQNVTVRGIVVGDFQGGSGQNGFYIQDAAGDGNATTSDGVFVFVPAANALASVDVAVGDAVQVSGSVTEFFTLTEIEFVTAITKCGTPASVAPTIVDLPESVNNDLERYEGMLISIPETLTVSQNFFQGRYGQVTLSSAGTLFAGGRLYNPTNFYDAGSPEQIALADENARRLIVLDDGRNSQNPNPIPYIIEGGAAGVADDTLRAGDTTGGIVGVLDFGSINSDSNIRDYRVQPTQPVVFTRANERTAAPAPVGGNVKVASFNVLNYFTTIDQAGAQCFPDNNRSDCRGADSAAEFERQQAKIVAAITAIDADVLGLIEMENNGSTAISNLVDALNAVEGAGTYAFVPDPIGIGPLDQPNDAIYPGGDDAIKVGLIYQPARVTALGAPLAANNPSYELGRAPVAQAFQRTSNGAVFSVIINHFKSKNCDPVPTGDNVDTGQGCYNALRVQQAEALLGFIAAVQLSTGDDDVLVIGDLNAYGEEDPVQVLEAAGLVDLGERFIPEAERYSYVFDGQAGELDHALATASLNAQASGATIWHINADEPSVIDYNTEFKPQDLYAPTPYRSSDHDPAIIGLSLVNPAPTLAIIGGAGVCPAGNGTTATISLSVADDRGAGSLTLTSASSTPGVVSSVVFGGSGANRTASITLVPSQNSVRSSVVTISVSDGFNTTSLQINVLVGTPNDNNITGDAAISNLILGLGGQDRLTGGTQADLICGGSGDNRIAGGDGDDTIVGGSNQDRIEGEGGNDTLGGGAGDDRLLGGDGDDTLSGGDNNDKLEGGAGNDSLSGGAGDDSLSGGDGNDALAGDAGNDALAGDAGDDTLTGGAQRDRFGGGAGADSATDFTPSQGDTSDGSVEIGV